MKILTFSVAFLLCLSSVKNQEISAEEITTTALPTTQIVIKNDDKPTKTSALLPTLTSNIVTNLGKWWPMSGWKITPIILENNPKF